MEKKLDITVSDAFIAEYGLQRVDEERYFAQNWCVGELRIKALTADFKDETDCDLEISLTNGDFITFCCKSNGEMMDYAVEMYDSDEYLLFEAESAYADDVMEVGCESIIEGVLIKYANIREI